MRSDRLWGGLAGCMAVVALATASPGVAQRAEPRPLLLRGVFGDHAVFQRDRPIELWGEAHPGEQVTLTFAGATTRVRADRSGRWGARLPAQPAGGPYELVAAAGGARQALSDIMVGDVWLCSGQSNMELDVSRALNAPSELAGAADSELRLLTVGHDTGVAPVGEFATPVRWQAATPGSVADFSATCYFMARDLRRTRKVPIGLIDASWDGTSIDAWRSEAAVARDPGPNERLAILRAYRADPVEGNRRWGELWQQWWRSRNNDQPWAEGAGGDWRPVPRLANWESWGDPALASFNGMLWYRTAVTLTPEQARRPASISVGWVDEVDQTWVNGVPVGNSYHPGSESIYVLPPGVLRPGTNSVVISVLDTYGAGGLVGPEQLRSIRFADGGAVPLGGWSYRVAPPTVGTPPRAPWETNAGLSSIYNGMIAPLRTYGLRGVAWYQGESDASAAAGYAAKLASLMADWREQFKQPELPFLVVQLAGWGPSPTAPTESGFAQVREEQRRAVGADRNAALAVAIDLGDRSDIHPANKQDVGRRLARAARRIAYGEAVTPSGPEAASVRREAGRLVVEFRNVDGELVTYSGIRAIGFELCGAAAGSCRFVEGQAAGSRVVLEDSQPATRVRFCWGDSPVCNLYDRAGLPVGPFELAIR